MKESKKNKKDNGNEEQDIYTKYNIIPPVSPIDSDEKREKIEQWRNHPDLQEYMNDTISEDYIARWLISRQWDVKRAVEMFLESMKWREKNGMADIVDEYPNDPACSRIQDFWPGSHTGEFFTKDGWPVYYERYGIVDPKYLFSHIATPQELVRYHCYEQESRERLRRELYERHGYTIGSVFIQDLGGLGWKHFKMLDTLKLVSGIDQLNFPEAVRKMYVINAPSIFTAVWKMIKPMVDKRTISKVSILKNGYEEELKALIDENDIPVWAGGKNTTIGISKTFNNQVAEDDELPEEAAIKLKIPPKEKVTIPIKVRTKNSTIGWRFNLEEFDIGFSLTFQRTTKSEAKVLVEGARFEKNEGTYLAKHRGIYNIVFDNTYSWTKKKVIKYTTYTQKPDEYETDSPNTARGDRDDQEIETDNDKPEENIVIDDHQEEDNKAEDS